MQKLNDTAKNISEKYITLSAEENKLQMKVVTRSAQSEINRIEAVINSLSNGKLSSSEILRLEAVCLKLLGRIRALSINTAY